ncbi:MULTISPECIES: acyl-[acyl-carrier-protein] thioesterase [unclassified Lentimicrobium]|uniref:acyl-[acyl-carrier-protein] thioesterase n=1 Tax=unclassified Lentimicrobium TaxID=2677434 RepID=UPI0015533B35|nr:MULTISPECIES: acyl-ACP thioesterase domain-containing protein [unclassified Lentimicrobium]NPD45158.1 hypothetical protein [Lentimicrobium sp. S6]NPD84508.1 hypothetical protein [Lentimicrobium sp. L6]
MQRDTVGVYPYRIKSYESDFNGKMSLNASFLFLQESAWQNALENGFGYEYLEKENAIWVLTRVLIQIDKWPSWKDEVIVKTWPRIAEGLFALRDYQILLGERVVAKIASSWLVLDKDTKRPRRISDFDFGRQDFLKAQAIDKPLRKLGLSMLMTKVDHRKVYSSDLDINKHVNNATYVKWIMDAYFSAESEYLKEFEINFIGELVLNDEFGIFEGQIEGEYFYQIKSIKDKEICRARIRIK